MYPDPGFLSAVKTLVVGHFGVGKTTCIASISEIDPLLTEEEMTEASVGVDDLSRTPRKRTTTVAMDFGRVTFDDDLVLYLFGTPGQERFKEMWVELSRGAMGALVLVDPDRLPESFPLLDLVERLGLGHVIGVNHFDGTYDYPLAEVREALSLPASTPVVRCDVRDRRSVTDALVTLVRHLLSLID